MPAFPGPPRFRREQGSSGAEGQWVLELEIEVASLDPEALLAQAEGFLVDGTDGREIGVVEGVEIDGESGEAVTLIVAGGVLGRRWLRADARAVEVLVPAEERLVVDPAGLAPAPDAEPAS